MNLKQMLQHQLQNLPGEESHLEMFPLRGKTSEALKTVTDYKLSGVMALFYPHDQSHKLILIERQTYDGKHSGQMSFPGGKLEQHETSSLHAALRETHEEIGIDPQTIDVIGQLSQVYIPVSNFLVHPYLGFLENEPVYHLNEREVKSVISFDITALLHSENRITTNIALDKGTTLKNVPAFLIEEKIVWGATALMLNEIRVMLQRIQGLG
ncbi:MAG: CoA pyrophosphatase [Bacteroidetes bacterium]|nr:CoA pyrophosphatase [Bacteroidota bacterium]